MVEAVGVSTERVERLERTIGEFIPAGLWRLLCRRCKHCVE